VRHRPRDDQWRRSLRARAGKTDEGKVVGPENRVRGCVCLGCRAIDSFCLRRYTLIICIQDFTTGYSGSSDASNLTAIASAFDILSLILLRFARLQQLLNATRAEQRSGPPKNMRDCATNTTLGFSKQDDRLTALHCRTTLGDGRRRSFYALSGASHQPQNRSPASSNILPVPHSSFATPRLCPESRDAMLQGRPVIINRTASFAVPAVVSCVACAVTSTR
jgi:hypothetical protein